ncbi:uncharacterized protein DUF4221 [Algoriphagus ratkowskyi]|uniref:DUF4221 domain-containing protein n=1 Tax=Algoriphagus ratkowskyi TaxID=57028 RepID=A0A2W7RFV2_9BACT|nr:DUF4221 family protein [Algoriphagus ratkowskyi]PZX59304.1 uncharacterized protein DUF4221 [Algoriphagus ratkowskyi]TXD77425.1 DUF4221 domain-containing protein [Algoriphagus ratkowskyi]
MKSTFMILCLALFFYSCGKGGGKVGEKNDLILRLGGQKIIPVNDKSTNFSILSQVHIEENGNQLYIHLNYFRSNPNYIFINSFADPALDLVLEFENEGPNGVGTITEFYFHSYDSIFLVDRYSYTVSLADSSGRVKQSYRLKENEGNRPDEDSVLPWSTSKSRMFLKGKLLYIPCVPDTDPFKSQYKSKNLLIKLDLETGEYTTLLGYPEWYQDGNYWGGADHILPSISSFKDPDKILVSFPLVDSIYLLDLRTEKMSPFFWMGNSHIEKPNPINFKESQTDKQRHFQLSTDYYFSLNYDPFRKEYWRLFYKKYDEESIAKILKTDKGLPNQRSVIIYDENLERIGEFDFNKDWRASGYNLFFLKEGVYVAVTPDSIEDKVFFRQLIVN